MRRGEGRGGEGSTAAEGEKRAVLPALPSGRLPAAGSAGREALEKSIS